MIYHWSLIAELIIHNKYKSVAEIGTSKGATVWNVLDILKKRNYELEVYYGIDPNKDLQYAMTDEMKDILLQRNYGIKSTIKKPVFEMLEMTSDEAFKVLLNQKALDLVYVDGLHTAEQWAKDIVNYTKLIKHSGCLVCHDYNDFTGKALKAQVDRLIGAENLTVLMDKRLESGRDNYLCWTYINKKRGCYERIRSDV